VLAAPVTWGLIAVGQARTQQTVTGWVDSRGFDTTKLIEPALYLAAAGILLGLIATLRISPLGPLVAGLLLGAPYVGMFISPLRLRNAVPDGWKIFNRQVPLRVPLDNGTLLLVAALLLVAVFSAQRWRRWPAPAPGAAALATTGPASFTPEAEATRDWAGDPGSLVPPAGPLPATEPLPPAEPVTTPELVPATEPVARLGATEGSVPPAAEPRRPEPAPPTSPPPPWPTPPQASGSDPGPAPATSPPLPASGSDSLVEPPSSGSARPTASQPGPLPAESPWAAPPRASRPEHD
jgi:hypothetical protein